jgi:hypothetical protein
VSEAHYLTVVLDHECVAGWTEDWAMICDQACVRRSIDKPSRKASGTCPLYAACQVRTWTSAIARSSPTRARLTSTTTFSRLVRDALSGHEQREGRDLTPATRGLRDFQQPVAWVSARQTSRSFSGLSVVIGSPR